MLSGDLPRLIGAAVVRDDDLSGHPFPGEKRLGLSDARSNGFGLIEARHEDSKFKFDRPNEPPVTSFHRGTHAQL